jgi:eukaryotic-like serine/threonine-protein kinase
VRQHGPLPAERVVHLLRQVCSALGDAHGNGLVHRDIKPANIVVSRAGTTFDFVKVLDFGLVRIGSVRSGDGSTGADNNAINLTADGSWSGTPGYMAPEAVLGTGDTDHRVDLYALGCVAYWLLTGSMVFTGENAVQVMLQHAQAEPKPPSQRTARPIPAALEELIMQCLAKDPARRPASAQVLCDRLDAMPLASVWTAERAEEWWAMYRPRPRDARPVADVLLSHEGHELRIGPRMRPS